MSTKVKGDKIKEGSINFKSFDTITKGALFNLQTPIANITKESRISYTGESIYAIYDYKMYQINNGGKTLINQGPPVYIAFINNEIYIEDTANYFPSNGIITLYADSTVKVPNPDWNAQEGEAGYIENKPDIDPVVWKYMCNPLPINDQDTCPNELLDEQGNLKYQIKSMYIVHYNGKYYGPISRIDKRSMCTFNNNGSHFEVNLDDDGYFSVTEMTN